MKFANQYKNAIAVLGDKAVGKTALISRLIEEEFDVNSESTFAYGFTDLDEVKYVTIEQSAGQRITHNIELELERIRPNLIIVAIDPYAENLSRLTYWNSLLKEFEFKNKVQKILVVTKLDERRDFNLHNDFVTDVLGFDSMHKVSLKNDIGLDKLRSSLNSLLVTDEPQSESSIIIRNMIDELCKLIAKNPKALLEIEWRDLERVIGNSLTGLGFKVELTPSSKDGGKDIIASCNIVGRLRTYYVEIKHWKGKKQPGQKDVSDFLEVNIRDKTQGGLFLSSGGFSKSVYAYLGQISRHTIRLGDQKKIVSLCQKYVKRKNGIHVQSTPLPEVLFEHTEEF